jgi:phosphotransferase system  glucose/maltose/N-acetylglucosamine-specific IIC component
MYVIYILILASIPMGLIYAFSPQMATSVAQGFGAWLRAIPDELYVLFGAGYLGYGAFRSFDKKTGAQK